MTTSQRKKILLKIKRNASFVILIGILGILFAGTLVVSWLSKRSQEIRQQASVDQGVVVVTPSASSNLVVGQPASIDFSVNTNSMQIDGVQLFFNINSTVGSNFDFELDSQSGLQLVAENIQDQGGGQYLAQILVIGQVAQPYSTNNTVQFGRLTFTPTQAGSVNLSFDNNGSRATAYQSNPVEDQLRTLGSFNVQISSAPTPTATSVTQPNNENPTPTPTSGSGGVTLKQCNESCTSHANCASNLACIGGVCRLASNPSNTSCQGVPDQGIRRSCNEYCADSNECATGLTCHFNRCRNPQAVNSTSCQTPTPTPTSKSTVTTGGTTATKTPTPRPTATSQVIAQTSPSAQPSSTGLTNVFGSSPDETDPEVSFTPSSTPQVPSPLPTSLPDEEESNLNRLPQILLIAAIISLPILFFTPLLIAKMAKKKPQTVATNGLEHKVSARPEPPKTQTISTPQAMQGFAGVTPTPPKMEDDQSMPEQKITGPKD